MFRQNYVFLFLILIINIIVPSCKNEQIKGCKIKKKNKIVAIINNKKIYLKDIDTIVAEQIYQLRLKAIENLLVDKLLRLEADKHKISYNDYLKKEIYDKVKTVSISDIKKYSNQYSIDIVDTQNVINYLLQIKRKRRMKFIADSLRQKYNVEIKLQPPFYKKINPKNLYYHKLVQNNSNIIVYVISDYKCPKCQEVEKKLKFLYKKYKNKVSFRFVYFSPYIDKLALAAEAAAKQKKFIQMHDLIFNNPKKLYQDNIEVIFAKKLKLDMKRFKQDMQDTKILEKILKNKEILLKSGVYSTPTFIVCGKIIDGKYSIDYLDDIIIKELNEKNN
jgi:protein-disulfide isomerase